MEDKLTTRNAPDERRTEPGVGLDGIKARQGAVSGRVRKVMIVSTTLAVAAMLGTWWYFV